MGTRLSASSGSGQDSPTESVAPLPPITAAPPPATPSTPSDETNNPGDYEDIGKKVKEHLFPTCIDGTKMVIQKGLSSSLQTTHTLTLGSSTQPDQWQFGATYVGTTKIGENDYRPVMIGDMSNSGSFTGLLIHQFGPLKLKFNAQTQKSQWVGYQGTVDYVGSDFTASFTLANPDLISGSGVAVLQYLQSITKRLALGSELVYQRSGGMEGAMVSVGGYYNAPLWKTSARLGIQSWNINYQQSLDKNFTLVASVDGSLMQSETSSAIGYKLDVGDCTMRGKVTSHGIVSATLEKRLDPLPATLMLSGEQNHWKDAYKFGMAVVIG